MSHIKDTIRELEDRIESLRNAIKVLESEDRLLGRGEYTSKQNKNGKTMRTSTLEILGEYKLPMSSKQVLKGLRKQGFNTNRNSVTALLSYLLRKGEVVRTKRAQYSIS